ncbi:5014_t:CDS:2, partial [Diversispora eburnea]
ISFKCERITDIISKVKELIKESQEIEVTLNTIVFDNKKIQSNNPLTTSIISLSVNPILFEKTRKTTILKSPLLEEEKDFEITITSLFTSIPIQVDPNIWTTNLTQQIKEGDYFGSPKPKTTMSDSTYSLNKLSSYSRDQV